MSQSLLAEATSEFHSRGYFVVRSAIPLELLAEIRREWLSCKETSFSGIAANPGAPSVVFWTHGNRVTQVAHPLSIFSKVSELARHPLLVSLSRTTLGEQGDRGMEVRLLEVLFLYKPPVEGHVMHWHQDASYSPFCPNRQITFWIPLDPVDPINGTIEYAIGSHLGNVMGMVDLHTGERRAGESRPAIPTGIQAEGFEVSPLVAVPGDIVFHHSLTWHRSSENRSTRPRLALIIRYLVGENRYAPIPARPNDPVARAGLQPGDIVDCDTFPLIE